MYNAFLLRLFEKHGPRPIKNEKNKNYDVKILHPCYRERELL